MARPGSGIAHDVAERQRSGTAGRPGDAAGSTGKIPDAARSDEATASGKTYREFFTVVGSAVPPLPTGEPREQKAARAG
jgi:hypothetical protein